MKAIEKEVEKQSFLNGRTAAEEAAVLPFYRAKR
jgi:hypothetical protein